MTNKKIHFKTTILISIIAKICLCLLVLWFIKYYFINSTDYTMKTHTINQTFNNISLESVQDNIRLISSDNGYCKVICPENQDIYYSTVVDGDTFKVIGKSKRLRLIETDFNKNEVTVCLPMDNYTSLNISDLKGDVDIPKNFSFETAQIVGSSGDIRFFANAKNNLSLKTASGDTYVSNIITENIDVESLSGNISLHDIKLKENLKAMTASGNLSSSGVECQNFDAKAISGDISLLSLFAYDEINAESQSGIIKLEQCDANKR